MDVLLESKNEKHLPLPIDDGCPTGGLIGLGNRQSSLIMFPLDELRLRYVDVAGETLAVTPLKITGGGEMKGEGVSTGDVIE